MEWVGIKINRAYVTEAQAFEQREVDRYKREFYDISGGRSFIDSNKALDEAFRACGYDEIPVTEKGNPSFTDAALEGLGGKLAECVRCIRHHEKRIGTYYSSFLHYAGADDVIHPNMKQGGTETGRFSYSEPNLQNVPKEEHAEDGHPSIVRRSFVPRDGKCFVMIDYKQQEYRLMLDYAGETQLIAEVNAGADVHQAMADMVGITRQQAKTLNFAVLYGASSAKIAGMLKIGNAEATHLLNLYYSKLPRVKAFKNAVIKRGEMRGYIINWAGRRCHIDRRDWAYVLPNHLIQGGGADVIKFAMVKIAALLEGTKSAMTLQIHDELLIAMDPDDFHLIPKVQQIMESVYPAQNGIVLATSVSHSFKSWGAPDVVEGLPI
jgi:DNA polymerase-1